LLVVPPAAAADVRKIRRLEASVYGPRSALILPSKLQLRDEKGLEMKRGILVGLLFGIAALLGCNKTETAVDKAAESVKAGAEDVKDAGEAAVEDIKDAGDAAVDKIEDAAEDVKDDLSGDGN
jgi:hypothetical protein